MNISYPTMPHQVLTSQVRPSENQSSETLAVHHFFPKKSGFRVSPLRPLKQWVEHVQIKSPRVAHLICRVIPAQCPFARVIQFRSRILFQIPPLCQINPLYEELMGLRFRALCYLADECGQDISSYC
ncbi:MAG: nitrogenase [Oscillatoriales cyanobacterium RM2_1_1]|nr:nitrogenase [Oscillatoriales cyanobacterium SM2_3_0]NJO45054.1 nitrogenase [Oscillatoriales cyanobacterium RM2_1_1]